MDKSGYISNIAHAKVVQQNQLW